MSLQMFPGERRRRFRQGFVQSPHEPILEHAHTTDAVRIKVFPCAPQLRLLWYRQVALKTKDHALERGDISGLVGLVTREMNVQAAAA